MCVGLREHVLPLVEAPDDPRPGRAIEVARAWTRGELPMMQARRVGRAGHRECRRQRDRFPDAIHALVLDDQRLRNDLCWEVFEVIV